MQSEEQTFSQNMVQQMQNMNSEDYYQGEPADAGAPAQFKIKTAHHDDNRPAPVRIAELFVHMQPHKRVLRSVLEACLNAPCSHEDVYEQISKASSKHYSVYSPENFCDLLVKSGALQKVTQEGEPFPEGDPEPKTVVIDGVEYLEPVEPPELFYSTTPDGKDALEADDSTAPMEELFEREAFYAPIYLKLLTMCAEEGGATMPQMDAAIIDDPLVQQPRYYATKFVSSLEQVGAVSWEPGWCITEIGQKGIEILLGA